MYMYRGFAQRGTHLLYAHDFAISLGFLFVQSGMEKKKKKKRLNFPVLRLTSWKDLKFPRSACADILVTQLQFGNVVQTK